MSDALNSDRPSATSPTEAIAEHDLPYRNRFLVHHLFGKERGIPDDQIDCFERLSFETGPWPQFKLRYGLNPIRLSHTEPREGILRFLKNIPMLCFTDVPAKDSPIHAKEYGKFGLVFKSQFILDFIPHPVQYVWPIGTTADDRIKHHHKRIFEELNIFLSSLVVAEEKLHWQDFAQIMKFVLRSYSYYQPMMEAQGDARISKGYFYMAENEWRIVHHDQFEQFLMSSDDAARQTLIDAYYARSSHEHLSPYLKVKPYYVQTIFVPEERLIARVEKILKDRGIQPAPRVITFEQYCKGENASSGAV